MWVLPGTMLYKGHLFTQSVVARLDKLHPHTVPAALANDVVFQLLYHFTGHIFAFSIIELIEQLANFSIFFPLLMTYRYQKRK